jgi:hypothetical protein
MERAVIMQRPFLLGNDSYTFNGDGTAKEATFHMWKVQSTEFEDYPGRGGNKGKYIELR